MKREISLFILRIKV